MKWMIVLLSLPVLGQVNIEKFRTKPAGSLGLSFDVEETETSKNDSFGTHLLVNRILGDFEWLAMGSFDRARTDEEETKDKHFFHGRAFYRFPKGAKHTDLGWHYGPEAFVQHKDNSFSNQRYRTLIGAGLRVMWHREKDSFRGGLSVMREKLRVDEEDLFAETTLTTRLNHYLSFTAEKVSCTVYYQPAVDQFSDYNLSGDGTLTLKFGEKWSFITHGSYTENTENGIRDRYIRQGIAYSF